MCEWVFFEGCRLVLVRALGTLGQLQNLPDGPTDNPQTQTQKNKTKGGKGKGRIIGVRTPHPPYSIV